jgi:two-component system, NarL family, response regulator NreC
MITIVLVEDHTIVRQGFKLVLAADKELKLVGEANDGLEAVRLVGQTQPNVLILDLMIPRLHGLEVIRQVRAANPETRIIVLSMHADEPYVVEALRSGALGYVLKDCTSADLVKAVRDVHGGRRYLSPAIADMALNAFIARPGEQELDVFDTLTNRERLVLQLAAEGNSSTEIGAKLFISPRTAETHRTNLMRKLSLRSQTDLVRYAIRKKLISA